MASLRQRAGSTTCEIDSVEAHWNGRDDGFNLGHKVKPKGGYFPVTPQDTLMDLRNKSLPTWYQWAWR